MHTFFNSDSDESAPAEDTMSGEYSLCDIRLSSCFTTIATLRDMTVRPISAPKTSANTQKALTEF